MFIETRGQGPALALIHGWAMHGGVFAPLVERLAARHTLHLVDLPGHGHARDDASVLDPAPVAAELVERIGPAVWLGWSLGGQFALRAALDHPAAVQGLVMLASSPCFVRAPDWPHGVGADVFGEFGAALQQDLRGTLDGFLALQALGAARGREHLRDLRQQLLARGEPSPAALQQGLALLDRLDLRDQLPRLAVPSLWIAGRQDRLVPAAAMTAAAALAPNARSVVIDSAGHAPFVGDPDAVSRELDGFLAEVCGRTAPPRGPEISGRHPREGGDPMKLLNQPIATEQAGRGDQARLAPDSRLRGNDEQPAAEGGSAAPVDPR